jgi:hypothetical protein
VGAQWGETDEVPGSATRFEYPSRFEAEVLDRLPDGLDDISRGVVGVERCASRRVPSGVRAEEPTGQLPGVCQFAAVVVEDLRDGSPARPAGEDALLIGGRSGGPIPELL